MKKLNLFQLSAMELQFHVEKLQVDYIECIDDDRLEQWPEFFVDNCFLYSDYAAEYEMPLARSGK